MIGLDEIAHEELLLLVDGHCLRDQVLDVCHTNTGIANINTRETSLGTLLALVEAGDGITLIPALTKFTDQGRHSTVAMRRETTGTARRTVRLVNRASYPRPEFVARLASIIRENVAEALVKVLD